MVADKIATVLQGRAPKNLSHPSHRLAAVLMPIQEREDGDYLVLTKRAEELNHHRGQVAFPGGRVDAEDRGELEAALRESYEEIGIDPSDVRVLGRLDQVTAAADFVVTPFRGNYPRAVRIPPQSSRDGGGFFSAHCRVARTEVCNDCRSSVLPRRAGLPFLF